MRVFYNEIDPYAAQWLRNLVAAGHIAPGVVDERSIEDIEPAELVRYTQCHFFAGIGVWSHALRLAGWPDDRPVWTGSCPCQPFSQAGKGAGFADQRHLWPAFHHLIRECRPPVIFGEQVASKDGLGWLDVVQVDLEAEGYAVGATDLCAAGVGAPHIRQRLYWVSHRHHSDGRDAIGRMDNNNNKRLEGYGGHQTSSGWHGEVGSVAEAGAVGNPRPTDGFWRDADWLFCRDGKWRPVESGTFPLAHGASARVGRLRSYGNAIVAQVAQTFVEAYLATSQ